MNINKSLRNLICGFVWSRSLRHIIRDGFFIQYLKNIKVVLHNAKVEKSRKFKYNLAFVICIKNKANYIKEWIEYHKIVGVEKFYVYDNDSSDNLYEVLLPYITEGLVDYTKWPGKAQQKPIYNDALFKHRYDTKWLGFIDTDEFVIPVEKNTIPEVLNDYDGYAGLSIHWVMYGSNGHKTKTDGLLTERFTKRANDDFPRNKEVKSIINPRLVIGMDCHIPYSFGKFVSVDENYRKIYSHKNNPFTINKIRINHYYCKSEEEFILKKQRGTALKLKEIYTMDAFKKNDKNDIEDKIIYKYITKIKENMKCKK